MPVFAGERSRQRPRKSLPRRCAGSFIALLNSLGFQTLMYFLFVMIFQRLANSIRMDQEFYLNQRAMRDFIEEQFDSSHNTFEDIRRVADIYEWGHHVLWPSLFGRSDPCYSHSGATLPNRSCTAHGWPDGEGAFGSVGHTGHTIGELLTRMDSLDWTDGLLIRQQRAGVTQPCVTTVGTLEFNGEDEAGTCRPELTEDLGVGDTQSFGYNKTHPSAPLSEPWVHWTYEQLGSAPRVQSAAIPSMRQFETSGFVAVVLPFFSEIYLPEQRGPAASVRDHRPRLVNSTNGKVARYFCARLSRNGRHVHQLCDPTDAPDGRGRTTGNVRRAIEELWHELKRGHFLDAQSRVLTLTLQLRSNHLGLRYRMNLMLETTSLGVILPSYDMQTRVLSAQTFDEMWVNAQLSLALSVFFAVLEVLEILSSGSVFEYLGDMWNLMDWSNFIIFGLVYRQVLLLVDAVSHPDCSSELCTSIGYFDDWRTMAEARSLKQYLSLCVCIQLFKVIKFTSQLVPKMSLMSSVLRTALADLVIFMVVFLNTMVSFSCMLFVVLGPLVVDFHSQVSSFFALFRALFGDFDIDEVMNNTSGYLNTIFLITYLFVAIFIIVSMFIAILAEAQAKVRDGQREERESGGAEAYSYKEYGVVAQTYVGLNHVTYHTAKCLLPSRVEQWEHGREVAKAEAAAKDRLKSEEQREAALLIPFSELNEAQRFGRLENRLSKLREAVGEMSGAVDGLTGQMRRLCDVPSVHRPRPYRPMSPSEPLPEPLPGRANPLLDPSVGPSSSSGDADRRTGTRTRPREAERNETRAARLIMEKLETTLSTHLTSIDENLEKRRLRQGRPRKNRRDSNGAALPATRPPPTHTQVV